MHQSVNGGMPKRALPRHKIKSDLLIGKFSSGIGYTPVVHRGDSVPERKTILQLVVIELTVNRLHSPCQSSFISTPCQRASCVSPVEGSTRKTD